MANEKLFTARQAAEAVLKKTHEVLAKTELMKAEKSKHDRCVEHVEANSPGVRNAHAVCVAEGVKPSNWGKAEGYKPENSRKENAKPSEHGAKEKDQPANGPAPKGEIHPKEHVEGASDDVRSQKDPQHNPKENAEGNNELAGTTPTQVGQDGKNKPGFDEMKGHLKLAKFIGHMEHKRKSKAVPNG